MVLNSGILFKKLGTERQWLQGYGAVSTKSAKKALCAIIVINCLTNRIWNNTQWLQATGISTVFTKKCSIKSLSALFVVNGSTSRVQRDSIVASDDWCIQSSHKKCMLKALRSSMVRHGQSKSKIEFLVLSLFHSREWKSDD